ncbi:PrsW family intramembrane metalloprotease [Blastococcus litoris]|uniref:PrsW family intramembrane metalloprotease n=1 Tax=Blastococcus litoris TaxID=2171622 RepID=UPI000E301EFA|nr:PrsW family intramembrane metalloprotease [Blastococcus litoris]
MTATVDPAPVPPADELERRRHAIEVSGWGARFRFIQPRNACFRVYLAVVFAGGWYVVNTVADTAGAFAQAYVASVLTTGLFALVFLYFLHRFDRFERTPAKLALAAFLIGGFGVPWAMALPGNAALSSLYSKLFGQSWATDWQAGLSAPFVEETAKGAAFLLVWGLAPLVIRTVYDGLIVGAYVGLGFQILEDMLYGQNAAIEHFGADQAPSVLHTFVIRSLTGIASHALYTALFAAGLIYLVGTAAQPRRAGRGIALMLAAIVIHGVWDATSALTDGSVAVALLLMVGLTVASVVILFAALRWARDREHGWMRDILAPEVTNGTITEDELVAVAGRRHDRKAAVRHRPEGMGRHREKHVLRAARDLAQDLARADGDDSPAVLHARAEIGRLRRHS